MALRDGLGDGLYTGTFRVISADGHPVSGGFTFAVGDAPPTGGSGPAVAELLDRSEPTAAVEGTYGAARALHYGALLFLVGGLGFAWGLWPRAGLPARWPRRTAIAASACGLACSLAGVALRGALGAGVGINAALDDATLDGSLDLYLFNRRTGAQIDRVRELTLRLVQPAKRIGPIKLAIPRKGPAHYERLDQPLGVPGRWEAQVTARVSDFDAYTAETEFDVREP